MAALAPITNVKYVFEYTSGPATDDGALASLTEDGPLLIASDHVVSSMLPDALVSATAPNKFIVATQDLLVASFGGFLLDAALRKACMHFTPRNTRWAKLMQDLDEAGLDTSPIPGDWDTAWPTFHDRLLATLLTLPVAPS